MFIRTILFVTTLLVAMSATSAATFIILRSGAAACVEESQRDVVIDLKRDSDSDYLISAGIREYLYVRPNEVVAVLDAGIDCPDGPGPVQTQ